MRVLRPSLKKWPLWLDIYPNFEFVPKIDAPVLIMHVSLSVFSGDVDGYKAFSESLKPALLLLLLGNCR